MTSLDVSSVNEKPGSGTQLEGANFDAVGRPRIWQECEHFTFLGKDTSLCEVFETPFI